MDPKTNRLLQQAGKYILLGKLNLALEQYLKLSEMEPEDTTIINTIGDLYVRLDDKENALLWYQKLAETFKYRELHSNATATYRKILKLSPKNQEAMMQLAQLYERQGEKALAKSQYQMIAKIEMSLGKNDHAVSLYQKICRLDPTCSESSTTLAQSLELTGKREEAMNAYLQSAILLSQQGNISGATSAAENIFRMNPKEKEFVKSFFLLLQRIDLTERGLEFLQSLTLNENPEFQLILSEVFLKEGNLGAAQKLLQGGVRNNPSLYAPSIKLLESLIARKELDASLELIEAVFDTSIRLQDEITLKMLLDSLAELDENNIRILKALTTILIRMNDKEKLEGYLRKLVILQLQQGDIQDGRESLNTLVVHGQSSFHLDLLNMINEATMDENPEALKETVQNVIQAINRGCMEKEGTFANFALALGVSELDLGMGMLEMEEEFIHESTR